MTEKLTEISAFEYQIINSIKSTVADRLESACDEAIDEAIAKVRNSVAEIVSGIALNIMSRVSLETRGTELFIHVKMDNFK